VVRRSGAALATVHRILAGRRDHEALTVRHEDLIRDPIPIIRRLCEHLGVEPEEAYLKDCASIVFPSARKSRNSVEWTPSLIAQVRTEIIDRYEFLAGYSHEG
jgi:hypothetical protein